MEVELGGDQLVVRELGAGAREWFRDFPSRPDQRMLLRDFLHVSDRFAIDELGHRLRESLLQHSQTFTDLKLRLCRFEAFEYSQGCIDRVHLVNKNHENYVPAKMEFTPLMAARGWPCDDLRGSLRPSDCSYSLPAPRAVITFLLPQSWYWAPAEGCVSAPARGEWKFRGDMVDNAVADSPMELYEEASTIVRPGVPGVVKIHRSERGILA